MTFREAIRVARRWRSLTVAGVLVGLVVGWITAPGTSPRLPDFEATHTLIVRAGGDPQIARLKEVLATLGPVPQRVAARLAVDQQLVKSKVSTQVRQPGLLLIIGRSTDPAQAEALADITAEELIVELGGETAPLRTLEGAVALPVDRGVRPPDSRPGRGLLLGAFGLVFGVAAAFGVDRFDDRVRSKATAEDALGVPVVSEVPQIARRDRELRLLTATEHSSFVEAYRRLRAGVVEWASQVDKVHDHPVIVVASATGVEGTTTTVAHLAATLGEIGRSVVVISADLRHPRLHFYFNKAREPGLTDILRGAPDVRRLADLNLITTVRGVRFAASGVPTRNPSPLLDRIGDHLDEAREMGAFVLIDAPPLLTTSDGADIARHADAVLLVVRSGWTSVRSARRSVELLKRLGIPVLGAVLVGSDGPAVRT